MGRILLTIIGFILPGIVQAFKGKITKGILMFILFIVSLLLFIIPGMGILRLILMIYSAYEVYHLVDE